MSDVIDVTWALWDLTSPVIWLFAIRLLFHINQTQLCSPIFLLYNDIIMSASLITGVSIVGSTVCSSADQTKHQSSTPLAFVRGINRWQVDSPHKVSVTRKIFIFDDVIMTYNLAHNGAWPPAGTVPRNKLFIFPAKFSSNRWIIVIILDFVTSFKVAENFIEISRDCLSVQMEQLFSIS